MEVRVASVPTGTFVSDDPVELAAAEIGHLARHSSLELALKVGEIIFRRIFRADSELLRRRGPKDVSFRRLAGYPALNMSASVLWRAVATYELSRRCPQVKHAQHVGVTHAREVLGPRPSVQQTLPARAEKEKWSVTQLTSRAASKRSGRGGRPKKPEILRALDALGRVAAVRLEHFSDDRLLGKLSVQEAKAELRTLSEIDERIERLEGVLRGVVNG